MWYLLSRILFASVIVAIVFWSPIAMIIAVILMSILALRFDDIVQIPWVKGAIGEFIVCLLVKLRLDETKYHLINDVTLPIGKGTTQIDHIIVSQYGVFVIETKHMKGWIGGKEFESRWTQKLYRKSYQFQNPLRQNHKHVKALEELLGIPGEQIFSVVVFLGIAGLKKGLPDNVTKGKQFIDYIEHKTEPLITPSKVSEIIKSIDTQRLPKNITTRIRHKENVKAMLKNRAVEDDIESNRHPPVTDSPSPKCHKCGSVMILREVKRGANKGRRFWGCSTYPRCRSRIKIQ